MTGLDLGTSGGRFMKYVDMIFSDEIDLIQSDARILVAYNICQWKSLTKSFMKWSPVAFYIGQWKSLTKSFMKRSPGQRYFFLYIL